MSEGRSFPWKCFKWEQKKECIMMGENLMVASIHATDKKYRVSSNGIDTEW